MGGVVACEMAQQLRRAGESVEVVILIEPGAPRWLQKGTGFRMRTFFEPVGFLVSSAWRHFKAMLKQGPTRWPEYIRARADTVAEMIRDKDVYRGDRSVRYSDRVSRANYLAMASYVAEPYPGATELIVASRRPIDPDNDPRMDWAKLSQGGSSLHYIGAGDSGQMFGEQHVAELSAILNGALERAGSALAGSD